MALLCTWPDFFPLFFSAIVIVLNCFLARVPTRSLLGSVRWSGVPAGCSSARRTIPFADSERLLPLPPSSLRYALLLFSTSRQAVSPSIRASTNVGSEPTVGSRGQGRGDEAVNRADLEITSPPPPAHGVVSTTPSRQPPAGRRLSGALDNTADRAGEAAAPAARTPAPGTPSKSPTTGRDVGYRSLLASGTRTRTSETPRLSFFKSTTAGRDSGYRALLASGGRSPEERETRFLGSQM